MTRAEALSSAAIKWGLPALLAGVVAGAVVDRYAFPPEPRVVEKLVVRTEEVRVEIPVPTPSVPAPLAPTAAPPPKAAPQKPESKGAVGGPGPIPPEAMSAAAPGTNVERQLLEGARTALVRRDANSALQTLEKLQREFPRGQLAEERDSLQVQALQQARRDADAKAAAKAFLERYPHSVFGPAVEAVLHGENELPGR